MAKEEKKEEVKKAKVAPLPEKKQAILNFFNQLKRAIPEGIAIGKVNVEKQRVGDKEYTANSKEAVAVYNARTASSFSSNIRKADDKKVEKLLEIIKEFLKNTADKDSKTAIKKQIEMSAEYSGKMKDAVQSGSRSKELVSPLTFDFKF